MMKIVKNKEKGSFKSTLIKIGIFVVLALMVFGATRSCISVKAEAASLEVNQYYYWDTNPNAWLKDLAPQSNSYKTVSSNGDLLSVNGFIFNTIRFGRFFPEPSFSEYFIEYYNSITSSSLRIYSCVYDFTDVNNVTLLYSNWYCTSTFQLLNSNVSYSGLSESTFLDVINLGTIDNFGAIYQEGYSAGYNAGVSAQTSVDYNRIYNDGYLSGYNNGYDDGLEHGYDLGISDTSVDTWTEGYNEGLVDGYNEGYDSGIAVNNPYTFKRLIFAVFEVPVEVVSGLFDWNFLGYNLKNFVFTLLTFSVIVAIVRRFI